MIGINLSGAEFGGSGGTHNHQYHYPTFSEIKYYVDKGVDLIRLPFVWERMQATLGGPLNPSELALLKQVLIDADKLGIDVVIDLHNFGRYNGNAIGSPSGPTNAQFADFWSKLASALKDSPALSAYDIMNEPHDMGSAGTWKSAAQAAVNAIREVDMKTQIQVEGDGWAGAHSWLDHNADLILADPGNNLVYQAHQYFDKYNQGFYNSSYDAEGAYPMVGVDRLKPFVEWLSANNLKGFIGEFGVPSNDARWLDVQKNVLDYMNQVGLDGTAWGGGTWWPQSYPMFMGAPGAPDSGYLDLLENYFESAGGITQPPPAPTPDPTVSTPAPAVSINDVTVREDAGTATFTLTRSGNLTTASSINYATENGTAVAGSDIVGGTGTVNFAPGEATKTISIAITNDTAVERSEVFSVRLTGPSNATISDGQGVGTINDNDVATPGPTPNPTPTPAPSLSINDVTVREDAGTAIFTVTRTGNLAVASSVSYRTEDGTTTSSDIVGGTGTVNFAPGEATKTISIAITNDTAVERSEVFSVRLTGPSNATISDGQGVGTINDNDVATPGPTPNPTPTPAPSLSINDVMVREDAGTATFTLIRSGALTMASSVNYATENGTAAAGSDYAGTTGTLNFAPGETTKTISISITNDTAVESAETFTIRLTDASNATISDGQGVGTINDNDVATPSPQPGPGAIMGTEADNTLTGTAGQDRMFGLGGNDLFNGTGGADTIDGGAGIDTVSYHWSGAAVNVDLARTKQMYGDAHGDQLFSVENVTGSRNADTLMGDAAVNLLSGLGGDDVLNGRGGADVLAGGAGNDRFVFDSPLNAEGDRVTDFSAGDILDFSQIDANSAQSGDQSFSFIGTGAFTGTAGHLRIYTESGRTYIGGDFNGDGLADFTVAMDGLHMWDANALIL